MPTKKELEAQLAETKEKLAQVDTTIKLPDSLKYDFMDEMNKIRRKATVDTNKIKVVDFVDHKNISLWTKWGYRVGPMHRTNAEQALQRFVDIGIPLTVDKPTPDEIKEYNETPVGKARLDKEIATRARKMKSRKKGNLEKLMTEMAKMTGQTVESINKLLDQPVSLSEGRKAAGIKG